MKMSLMYRCELMPGWHTEGEKSTVTVINLSLLNQRALANQYDWTRVSGSIGSYWLVADYWRC